MGLRAICSKMKRYLQQNAMLTLTKYRANSCKTQGYLLQNARQNATKCRNQSYILRMMAEKSTQRKVKRQMHLRWKRLKKVCFSHINMYFGRWKFWVFDKIERENGAKWLLRSVIGCKINSVNVFKRVKNYGLTLLFSLEWIACEGVFCKISLLILTWVRRIQNNASCVSMVLCTLMHGFFGNRQ